MWQRVQGQKCQQQMRRTKRFANVLTSNSSLQVMNVWCLAKIELLAAECEDSAQWISREGIHLLFGYMIY